MAGPGEVWQAMGPYGQTTNNKQGRKTMDVREYEVKIKGMTPLLLHADDVDWADEMTAWSKDPANKKNSKAGDDRSPAWRWTGYLYHDDKVLGIGEANIQRSLMDGGAMVPVPGGRSGKTFKSQSQSGMFVRESLVPILVDGKTIPYSEVKKLIGNTEFHHHREFVQGLGFQLKTQRAKVGQNKHIRVRPLFPQWDLVLRLCVHDEQLTKEVLQNIFSYAGQYKGLGDWRPGAPKSPGRYGMYELESMKRI